MLLIQESRWHQKWSNCHEIQHEVENTSFIIIRDLPNILMKKRPIKLHHYQKPVHYFHEQPYHPAFTYPILKLITRSCLWLSYDQETGWSNEQCLFIDLHSFSKNSLLDVNVQLTQIMHGDTMCKVHVWRRCAWRGTAKCHGKKNSCHG